MTILDWTRLPVIHARFVGVEFMKEIPDIKRAYLISQSLTIGVTGGSYLATDPLQDVPSRLHTNPSF